jgi:fluoroacetyl-CoA thioesterase
MRYSSILRREMMIQIGEVITRDIGVDDGRAISFMGPDLRVYSTPSILLDIELASRDLLLPMLEEGQDSVGSHVSLDHLAAVSLGGSATIVSKIVSLERRRVTFEATVTSGERVIARATHVRTIVAMADLKARIAELNS